MLYVDLDGVLGDFDAHYKATFGAAPNRPLGDDAWAKIAKNA